VQVDEPESHVPSKVVGELVEVQVVESSTIVDGFAAAPGSIAREEYTKSAVAKKAMVNETVSLVFIKKHF
jgi:hypothetical protein